MGNAMDGEVRAILGNNETQQAAMQQLAPLTHDVPVEHWAKYAPVGAFVPVFKTPLPKLPPLESVDPQQLSKLDDRLTDVVRTAMSHEARYETVAKQTRTPTTKHMSVVPDVLQRAMWSALNVFRDPVTQKYHPGAVRTIQMRLYAWLHLQAEGGRLTRPRVALLLRWFHLIFDQDGQPRLFVGPLIQRFLPFLAWAEERYGAKLFVTPFGDAADLEERVYLPDGEPTVAMGEPLRRKLGLKLEHGANLLEGSSHHAGMVEAAWRARTLVLPPGQWFVLMCFCEALAQRMEREERTWDSLVLSQAPLPQTAVVRATRRLLPPDVKSELPPQWVRPSSLVVTLMAHILALLEDCETLRVAVTLSESNVAVYAPDARPNVTVLFPTLHGRYAVPTQEEWHAVWEATRAWCPLALSPVFLSYIGSVMVGTHNVRGYVAWAALLRDVMEPLLLGLPDTFDVDAARLRLQLDYQRCLSMSEQERLSVQAPLCNPPEPAIATLRDYTSNARASSGWKQRVYVRPSRADLLSREFELRWDSPPLANTEQLQASPTFTVPTQLMPARR